jgi:hypothetical protein
MDNNDYQLLEYLIILLNIIKRKNAEIKQLRQQLANCPKTQTITTTKITQLEQEIITLKQQVKDKYPDNTKLINDLLDQIDKQQQPEDRTVCIEPLHPYINIDPSFKDIDLKTLKDTTALVTAVVNKVFTKPPQIDAGANGRPNYIEFVRPKIEGYESVDAEYELKSIMSELTTNYFLENPDRTAHFIKLIVEIFTDAINDYKTKKGLNGKYDLVFLYKGGNAMKAIFYDYAYENPGVTSDIILQYFKEFFGKSDADFQVYIYPGLDNYDEVYPDICLLTYLLLNRIRNIFLSDITQWLDFYDQKKLVQGKILEIYLAKLNKSNTVTKQPEGEQLKKEKEQNFSYYQAEFLSLRFLDTIAGTNIDLNTIHNNLIDSDRIFNNYGTYKNKTTRFDFIITNKDPNNKDSVIVYKIPPRTHNLFFVDNDIQDKLFKDYSQGSELFITYNDTIQEERGTVPKVHIRFNLIRMKVNFQAVFRTQDGQYGLINIPAELIDVSVPHKTAFEVGLLLDNIQDENAMQDPWDRNMPLSVVPYKYVKVGNETTDNFTYNSYSRAYYIKDIEKIIFYETDYPWEDLKYQKRIKRLLFFNIVEFFTGDLALGKQFIDAFGGILANQQRPGRNNIAFGKALEGLKKPFPQITKNHDPYWSIGSTIDKLIEYTQKPTFDVSSPKVQEYIGVFIEVFAQFNELYTAFTNFVANNRIDPSRLQTVHQLGGATTNDKYKSKYLKYKHLYCKNLLA